MASSSSASRSRVTDRRVEPPLVFLMAGEASGDLIGAHLMNALNQATGGRVRFAGVGGPRMMALGFESLMPFAELALVGFAEVVPHLPRLVRRLGEVVQAAEKSKPAIIVTIDAPGFTLRVQRKLGALGVPRVHIVAPQVWAYRPGRAAKLSRFLDHLLVLLPFEPPWFERHHLACTFIGHPMLEEGVDRGDGAGFRARHGIAPDAPVLVLLPGSRRGEIKRLLSIFLETTRLLLAKHPSLRVVLPAVPDLASTIREAVGVSGVPVEVVEGRQEKIDAFAAGRVALAASGSVTLELAIAGLPMVVGYRLNPLTAAIARRIVKVPSITLPNLVIGRKIAPEFVLKDCVPEALAPAVDQLLVDETARRAQIDAFRSVASALRSGGKPASERAAEVILSLIAARQSQTRNGRL